MKNSLRTPAVMAALMVVFLSPKSQGFSSYFSDLDPSKYSRDHWCDYISSNWQDLLAQALEKYDIPDRPLWPKNPVLPDVPVSDPPAKPDTPATPDRPPIPAKPETPVGPPSDLPVGGKPDLAAVAEIPADTPVGSKPDDVPVGKPDDLPVGKPDDLPEGGKPDGVPYAYAYGKSGDVPGGKPDDVPVGKPDDLPVGGKPDDVPVGKPDDLPVGEKPETPVEVAAAPPAELPVTPPTPENPVLPETPVADTPAQPETPATPTKPETPVGPPADVPVGEKPETPVEVAAAPPAELPLTPPTPENPVLPETPVADTPAQPETPATPTKPETPVGPPADVPVGGSETADSGNINVDSGKLVLNETYLGGGNYTINQGGTLKGSGMTDATVTIAAGGILSPGNSPGTLTTASQTWNDGGTWIWEINDSDGTIGGDPGWDSLNIEGSLDLSLLSIGGFTISITSLDLDNNLGEAAGFDEFNLNLGDLTGYYSFLVAETTLGVIGFDENLFNVDTSDFLNLDPDWEWNIVLNDNNLFLEASATVQPILAPQLNFSLNAVPEPSSIALLGLGGLALMLRRKRS